MKTKETKEEKTLNDILKYDIYRDITLVDDLVELLENVPPKYNDEYREFCMAYTILLFQTYIENKHDKEMMLAACGLLKGYEFKAQQLNVRMTKYREYAQGHNPWIKSTWANTTYAANCKKKLKEIGAQLERVLLNKKSEIGGVLGLIDKVPAKLELPEPIYMSEVLINTEDDGKNITFEYDPKKGTRKISVPPSIDPERLRIICAAFVGATTGVGLLIFMTLLVGYANSNIKPNRIYEGNRIYNIREEKDGGKWIEAEPQASEYVKTNEPTIDENKINNKNSDKDFKSLF